MKRFILSEEGVKTLKKKMLEESYSDKVDLVKKFLDGNFMRGNYERKGDDGTIRNIGVFIQLNPNNKLPTDYSLGIRDVFDMVQDKFSKILSDINERDGFLMQAIKDWYDKKITSSGNLSNYKLSGTSSANGSTADAPIKSMEATKLKIEK